MDVDESLAHALAVEELRCAGGAAAAAATPPPPADVAADAASAALDQQSPSCSYDERLAWSLHDEELRQLQQPDRGRWWYGGLVAPLIAHPAATVCACPAAACLPAGRGPSPEPRCLSLYCLQTALPCCRRCYLTHLRCGR